MEGVRLRWSVVWTIFLKELREITRDRKTLFMLLAIPLLFYPGLLLLVTQVGATQTAKLEASEVVVGVVGGEAPAGLVSALKGEGEGKGEGKEKEKEKGEVRLVPVVDARAALSQGEVAAVLEVPSEIAAWEGEETVKVRLWVNSVEPESQEAEERLRSALRRYEAQLLTARLERRGLAPGFPDPVDVIGQDVAPPERQTGKLLSTILPMLVLVFMGSGAFNPAVDLTAGERERKTIQTLMTAPVRPLEVVVSKFLAVVLMTWISGAVNVASLGLVTSHALSLGGGAELLGGVGEVSALDVAGLVGVVGLMGLFLAALMMTVASLASTPKEAQSYMTLVYLLTLVPAGVAQVPGIELTPATAFVPVLSLALVIKELLLTGFNAEHLFLVGLSTGLMTLLLLLLAARIFARSALAVTLSDVGGLFARAPDPSTGRPRLVPSPDEGLALVALLFLVLYYAGSLLQSWSLLAGLALTLAGLLALTLGAIRLLRLDVRATLHLTLPSGRVWAGAALLGLSSMVWVQGLTQLFHEAFLPIPESFAEAMAEALTLPEGLGGNLMVLGVMALMPAVCEEAVFRGWLLSSFRGRLPGWGAVLVSSALFGVFHFSIYRFLGTFLLGLIMGAMVWRRRSLAPSVLFHFLNNALALHFVEVLGWMGYTDAIPAWLVVASIVVSGGGLVLVFQGGRDEA
jgi:sodium transport system permease protein